MRNKGTFTAFVRRTVVIPFLPEKTPLRASCGIQRQQLRLRQRLRHVSSTSAARQHGRRRDSWSENEIVDFPGKQGGH